MQWVHDHVQGPVAQGGMEMKWLSVLILVVAVVTGVAVHGSRAAPIVRHSVAFAQCAASGGGPAPCQALTSRLALGAEDGPGDNICVAGTIGAVGANEAGIIGAGSDVSPDRWVAVALAAMEVARAVFQNWDRFFGDMALGPAVPAPDHVFDPVN